mgnify:CR=1 FL=1
MLVPKLNPEAKAFLDANETTVFGTTVAYGTVIAVTLGVLLFAFGVSSGTLFGWAAVAVVAFLLAALLLAKFLKALGRAPDLFGFAPFVLLGSVVFVVGLAVAVVPLGPPAGGIIAMVTGAAWSSIGLVWLAQVVRRRFIRRA